MKCLLKKYLMPTVIMFYIHVNAVASILVLEEYELFGCHEDSTVIPEISDFVIQKTDSLVLAELGERFFRNLETYKAYSFSEMPCIKLIHHTEGGLSFYRTGTYGYNSIIFNACDSSVCHFGGNTLQFSKVFMEYFPQDLDTSEIIQLIDLYLNTIHFHESYYILNSVDDFIKIFIYEGSYYGPNGEYSYPPIGDYEIWLKQIEEKIEPTKTSKVDESLIIELYTWLWSVETVSTNKLDRWKFKVSNQRIELLDRTTLFERLVDEW